MNYLIETTSDRITVEADEVDLIGIAAGSPGFFAFKKGSEIVLYVASKGILTIAKQGTNKTPK